MDIVIFLFVWAGVSITSAFFIWITSMISGPTITPKKDHIFAQVVVLLGMIIFGMFFFNQ